MKEPGFLNNLVAKNFLWINYHPIVYFAFFPLIGMYYTLIPVFSHRNFSSSRWARAPWPILLISGVGVYSHHLFMDTSQPYLLQLVAQNMSMAVAFGSGISVFTLLALIWRSKYTWTLTGKFLFASIIGWVIGGVMGVENASDALDIYEHNTYVIVSHFHLNGLDGIVLAAFGILYLDSTRNFREAMVLKDPRGNSLLGDCRGRFWSCSRFRRNGLSRSSETRIHTNPF